MHAHCSTCYHMLRVVCVQVKSGTIFDNVLITDDVEYAEEFGTETWGATKDAEKKMKDQVGGWVGW